MKSWNMIWKVRRQLAGALVLSMLLQDMSAFAASTNINYPWSGEKATQSETKPVVLDSNENTAPQIDAEFGNMQGGQAAVDGMPNAITMNKKAMATGPIRINTQISNIAYLDEVALHVDLPYIVEDGEGNILSYYGKRNEIEASGYTLLGGLEISFDAANPFVQYDPAQSDSYWEANKPAGVDLAEYRVNNEEEDASVDANIGTEGNSHNNQHGGGKILKIQNNRKKIQKIIQMKKIRITQKALMKRRIRILMAV